MPKDLYGPFDTLNLPVMKSCSVTDLVSFYKGIHATLFPLSTVQTPVFGSYVSCLRLLYPIHLATNSIAQDTRLQDHERLGHISFKRMRQLDIDGISPPTSKRLKPITCPVCITAKARRANRPAPSTPEDRPTEPWQDVYTDLSGKVRTASVTGAKYFAVFR